LASFKRAFYKSLNTTPLRRFKKIVRFREVDSFEDQFKKIYEDQFDRLYYFAKSIVKSDQIAEDVVAEVFLNLWKGRAKFSEIRKLDSYLFIAVKNQATRVLYEQPNSIDVSALENTVHFMDKVDPQELMLEKELTDALEEVVSKLPDQCQLIFRMAKDRQMKYNEIAGELGISVSTVRSQLSKASSVIRKFLYDKYYESDGTSDDLYRDIKLLTLLIAFGFYAYPLV
jgi:RNA polymerase sigma-70 factor (family 1)